MGDCHVHMKLCSHSFEQKQQPKCNPDTCFLSYSGGKLILFLSRENSWSVIITINNLTGSWAVPLISIHLSPNNQNI